MADKSEKISRYANRIPLEVISDLLDIIGKEPDYDFAVCLGGTSINDGCAGAYYWNSISTDAHDGFYIVKPTLIGAGEPGRWLRLVFRCIQNTYEDAHTSDGTATQTVSHGLGTMDFTGYVYIIDAGRERELNATIDRGTNDAIVRFIGGSEPSNGVDFYYKFFVPDEYLIELP